MPELTESSSRSDYSIKAENRMAIQLTRDERSHNKRYMQPVYIKQKISIHSIEHPSLLELKFIKNVN